MFAIGIDLIIACEASKRVGSSFLELQNCTVEKSLVALAILLGLGLLSVVTLLPSNVTESSLSLPRLDSAGSKSLNSLSCRRFLRLELNRFFI